MKFVTRRIWRTMEDSRTSYQELLVVRNNERGEKIYGRV